MPTSTLNTLSDLIARGSYSLVYEHIVKNEFKPSDLETGSDRTLCHMGRKAGTNTIITRMTHGGFRPGTIADLLEHGAERPNDQKSFPIACLGTRITIRGKTYFACLHTEMERRALLLKEDKGPWPGEYRFVQVRA